ncbi:hypothetical protein [Bacillus velezensis]
MATTDPKLQRALSIEEKQHSRLQLRALVA